MMDRQTEFPKFKLICIIVNFGMGSRILRKAKEYGITGGTIILAKGTISNAILNFLSLYDEKKEIVLMAANQQKATLVLEKLNKKYQFEKPNHGIAFTTSMSRIIGSRCNIPENNIESDVSKAMYQVIISIVNRGMAEDVVEAAKTAGSKGGTIINARGSGIHETSKLFNMDIEPEKEMVIILSNENVTENIVLAIRERLKIDQPGNGIVFVQDAKNVYGVYQ